MDWFWENLQETMVFTMKYRGTSNIPWIGFVGKIYRKPWFLPWNIGVPQTSHGLVLLGKFTGNHGFYHKKYRGTSNIPWIGFVGKIYRKPMVFTMKYRGTSNIPWIGFGKIYRKPWFLPWNIGVPQTSHGLVLLGKFTGNHGFYHEI